MAQLDFMLFNYDCGGEQADGYFDLEPLGQTVAQLVPHIFVLNEAATYRYRGSKLLYEAANTISRHAGKAFVPLLCWTERGDYPPAVFYQPEFVQVDQHMGTHPDDPRRSRNLVNFTVRSNGSKLGVLPIHFNSRSATDRLLESERIGWAADPHKKVIVAGDFNSISSGDREIKPNFENHPRDFRFNKGRWLDRDDPRRSVPIEADTRPLDRLLDQGLHDVGDLAYEQGMPEELAYCPTVNEGIDGHGPLRIDRILVSEPLKTALISDTYKVWVPHGKTRADFPSDHRAVSASFDI